MKAIALIVTLWLGMASAWAADDNQLTAAKDFFERFAARERAFDAGIADLYSDNAVVTNTRIYPTGMKREVTIPADKYKTLIKASMPVAKARGDYSTYTNITATPEGKGVRIKATRFSEIKHYESPLSMLLQKTANGEWTITEEISQSQP